MNQGLTPHYVRTRPIEWRRWLPGLLMLRRYEASWLPHDVAAGVVLATILVPVGIAYAEASGVPGICGLYATIVPLLAYALFGPSRILVLGPDSSLAAVILGVIYPLSGGDAARAIALAGMMAIVSGLVCIIAGMARLGFITELLSKPIRYGYMNGIALTVLVSQLPKLFGFSIEAEGPLRRLWAIAAAVFAGRANWSAFAIGVGTLVVILLLKNSKRVPAILIAVVGATAVVGALNLAERAGVSVLGPLPQGLPAFAIPHIAYTDIVPILVGGSAVALLSFADTSVLSRAYAAKSGAKVDPNQEMVGLGAANLAAGLFQGFPISSSASRTPVAEAAGARTQLTGVVGALVVALLLLLAPNLLEHLPEAALAAVVIAAAIGLIEINDLARIFRIQRWSSGYRSLVWWALPSSVRSRASALPSRSPSSSSSGTAGVRTPRCWGAPMASRDITTSRAIPVPVKYRGWSSFAGTRRCFSPTPSCSRIMFWRRRRNRRRACAEWSLPRNR